MLFFTFIKGGGHPPDRTPEPQWFFVNNQGGGVKSLLTNVNKKMFFFNEGFPKRNVSRVFCVRRLQIYCQQDAQCTSSRLQSLHYDSITYIMSWWLHCDKQNTECQAFVKHSVSFNFLTKKQVVQYAIQESVKIDHETMRSFWINVSWSLNINHVNFIFLHCENLHWRKLGRRVMQKCICMS